MALAAPNTISTLFFTVFMFLSTISISGSTGKKMLCLILFQSILIILVFLMANSKVKLRSNRDKASPNGIFKMKMRSTGNILPSNHSEHPHSTFLYDSEKPQFTAKQNKRQN
jgi:hypothetical protein